eukprot:418819-Alexandrium_andersonii.AAC.1
MSESAPGSMGAPRTCVACLCLLSSSVAISVGFRLRSSASRSAHPSTLGKRCPFATTGEGLDWGASSFWSSSKSLDFCATASTS